MTFTDPRSVISPKEHVSEVSVVLDTGEGGWALASLRWDGEKSLGLRWNGDSENPLGNPQSRGIPTWFVLPDQVAAVIREVFLKATVGLDSFNFARAKLRPLPRRLMDGKDQGSMDDEWLVDAWDANKGQMRLRNLRTDHFLVLYRAHIGRVTPDPIADAKNKMTNCMLELTVQVVFEDGNIRLEYGATAMRNIVERTTECLGGMQQFEKAMVARVKELGGDPQLTFRWNAGREFVPPPEALPVEVKARNGLHASAVLSREQLEDSHARVDRPDVVLLIDKLGEDLVPPDARRPLTKRRLGPMV